MSEPSLPFQIAEAISSQNDKMMVMLLLVVACSFVGMYFLTRTIKGAELREINKNFKNILKQQEQLERQTASINAAINKQSIEYQIRLSAYNERSVQAIDEIYVMLVELKREAQTLGYIRDNETTQKLTNAIRDFNDTFHERKLWLPLELAQEFEAFAKEIESNSRKFMRAGDRLQNPQTPNHLMEKSAREQEEYYDFIYKLDDMLEPIISRVSEITMGVLK
ncbi:hypothetical protein NA655_04335 [Pseudomonas kuykendallii]|uniref:Uncharacterized protein n=1 Tax=Pseudomonas kuykendallii TaxID=1007099 RepID=A0A1H3DKK1_9PSED|nr:hypothetical protein [Pseudomonas kuykendallii]MCQ4270246.1 hypothetical protein [Pseudomonas kuykendallii]SDX66921.1 hypothetical protein SAMN05216287_3462 [Pseudomonas kuykendallii]